MRATKNETELDTVLNLHAAITRRLPVTVSYSDIDGRETVRTIEPYEVKISAGGDLRVMAMCRLRRELRGFRLDRITHYTVHRGTFQLELPTPADPDEVTNWWSIRNRNGHEILQVELDTEGYTYPISRVLGKAKAESGTVRAVCRARQGVVITRLRRRDVHALH